MKKILMVGLISSVFSAGAFAGACTATPTSAGAAVGSINASSAGTTGSEQCICDGGAAGTNKVEGGPGTAVGANAIFIKNGFNMQCSANTIVSYNEVSVNAVAVGSGSKKGNQSFAGSSMGGSIGVSANCGTAGCDAAAVTLATAAAATVASSQ